MKKVFLGGTCNNSQWRELIIPRLKINYFNPVVLNWTEEAYQNELKEREICNYCLYVITPLMEGVYSIAEVIDDSNKRPEKTVFCFVSMDSKKEFSETQRKSLSKVGEMVKNNGGEFFISLNQVINFLNND